MQKFSDVVLDKQGKGVRGLTVTVNTYPGGLPATIYATDGGSPVASVMTDSTGRFAFYAANGHYSLTVNGASITPVTFNDIALYDARDERITAKDYGAKGDGVTDDASAIQAAADASVKDIVSVGSGTFRLASFISALNGALRLVGRGIGATALKSSSVANPACVSMQNSSNSVIQAMTLDVTASDSTTNGHPVSMIDVSDTRVRDVAIKGLSGQGSGMLIYPANSANYVQRVRLHDIDTFGVAANSSNTNGPLIVNGQFCQMRGLYSEGIVAYAIEYKNASYWSTGSDLIANNSCNGIGFGQTTTDQTGVSYSAVANFITKDCAQGIIIGKGGYNALANGVIHIQTPYSGPGVGAANKIGVFLSGGTVGNSLSNMLVAGSVTPAVRYAGSQNYVSLSAQNTGTIVQLDAGAAANVTEVQTPGARTSIIGAITDNSGNTALSGAAANPVYCHATGEYLGILGSRWRWQFAKSGVTPSLASQQWVLETAGDALPTILNDGTGVAGWLVQGPSGNRGVTYSWVSDYWRMYTGTGGFRAYGTVFRPETDLQPDLGASTFRFKTVYAQNIVLTPPASVTPTVNGQMSFELTNDTTLKIKVKGSDGIVRSTTLTLA